MGEGEAAISSDESWPEGQRTWVLSQMKFVTLDRLGINLGSTKSFMTHFWLPRLLNKDGNIYFTG